MNIWVGRVYLRDVRTPFPRSSRWPDICYSYQSRHEGGLVGGGDYATPDLPRNTVGEVRLKFGLTSPECLQNAPKRAPHRGRATNSLTEVTQN